MDPKKDRQTQGERFEAQDELGGRDSSEKRDEDVPPPARRLDEGPLGTRTAEEDGRGKASIGTDIKRR